MTAFTNPNFKTNKFDEYSDEEKREYASYLWECHECGQKSLTSSDGGSLNPCLKKDKADSLCGNDGHDLLITVVIGGHADTPRTAASLEGRKPGEPSHRKLHRAGCNDPECLDWAHLGEPGFRERQEAAHAAA